MKVSIIISSKERYKETSLLILLIIRNAYYIMRFFLILCRIRKINAHKNGFAHDCWDFSIQRYALQNFLR